MPTFLDFEKPIAELDARIAELRETASAGEANIAAEISRLEERSAKVDRVTADDVRRVARDTFRRANLLVCAVGHLDPLMLEALQQMAIGLELNDPVVLARANQQAAGGAFMPDDG